jgi:hypothetical protein
MRPSGYMTRGTTAGSLPTFSVKGISYPASVRCWGGEALPRAYPGAEHLCPFRGFTYSGRSSRMTSLQGGAATDGFGFDAEGVASCFPVTGSDDGVDGPGLRLGQSSTHFERRGQVHG